MKKKYDSSFKGHITTKKDLSLTPNFSKIDALGWRPTRPMIPKVGDEGDKTPPPPSFSQIGPLNKEMNVSDLNLHEEKSF